MNLLPIAAAWLSLGLPPLVTSHEHCSAPSFGTLEIAVDPANPARGTFPFRYLHEPSQPRKPTVIYIPGGPGFGSLRWAHTPEGLEAMREDLGLPEGFGLLLHDPRGVDCGSPKKGFFADGELRTELMAGDLKRVIQALRIKNPILYGHSYGTVVATHLAVSGLAPKAVVLAGVVGKASWGGESSVYKMVQQEWQRFKPRLPLEASRRLALPSPLGIDPATWGAAIESGLTTAAFLRDGESWSYELLELLSSLAANDPKADEAVGARIRSLGEGSFAQFRTAARTDSDGERVYQRIYCNELADSEYDSQLVNGEIGAIPGSDLCEGSRMLEPYDSARYRIQAPIFYFNGTGDPATALSDAAYHFERQQAPRHLVSIQDGGHHNLGSFFGDCVDAFWKGMLAEIRRPGSGRFEAGLKDCAARPYLRLRSLGTSVRMSLLR
jgi:pimeloyl-ACP methyl ester carboxylesterase